MNIEAMRQSDWSAVAAIYAEGIASGQATFETAVPAWAEWDGAHRADCRLVARRADQVVAWAALSPVSRRQVYAGVAEVSLYVAAAARRQGIGRALLQALIAASERQGLWTLQAGVLAENQASLALCQTCGFRVVGRRERLGQLHGVWRDVILLERRSQVVGE
jgi:L-amino acid N-acyltransferase YncA